MTLPLVRQSIRACTACVLVTMFALPQNVMAQAHVVSLGELQKQTLAAGQERQRNLEIVTRFLSSPTAEKAMKIVHTDNKQVKTAIASLSDEELARLAQRAQKTEADFAAGSLSDRELLIVLVAVLVLVVIILAATH